MFIKVCGITRLGDALHALEGGATALGFVFWPASPRCVTAEQVRTIVAGLPTGVTTVGVFVNEPLDVIQHTLAFAGVNAVQLHGDEPASYGASGRRKRRS
jgi:phosphoribosylanthranilate isomerase